MSRIIPAPFSRALVIGCSGAGKSRFSRALAASTGLPLVSLDAEFWRPGWVITPRAEWRPRVAELVARPAWIMDGNFDSSLDIRLPRADAVFLFDLPRHVCLRRILWRVATSYGQVRPEMAAGCPERFDLAFLRWVWRFNEAERPQIMGALATHGGHVSPVIFRHDAQVRDFLAQLAGKSRARAPDAVVHDP